MTSFFRSVDKRAIYRWYNLIRRCAGEYDWLFHWQHKSCATFSANVNINYRLPIKVYYRICTLKHIRIETNHGIQNAFWVFKTHSGFHDLFLNFKVIILLWKFYLELNFVEHRYNIKNILYLPIHIYIFEVNMSFYRQKIINIYRGHKYWFFLGGVYLSSHHAVDNLLAKVMRCSCPFINQCRSIW